MFTFYQPFILKTFWRVFLAIILSGTLITLYGCSDEKKSDPAKNGGKGQSNQTQVDLKEKEDIDEKSS